MLMALQFLALSLLSLSIHLVAAAPSPEEIALRAAITAPGETTYNLTKSILLTRDLPPLPNGKILTVRSAAISGAPFRIDGAGKYLLFRSGPTSEVKLTLTSLILTRSKFAAVDIVGVADEDSLSITSVNFVNNPRALNLKFARGVVSNCRFSGSTRSAVVLRSEEGPFDVVVFRTCTFSDNKAERGLGGGAIRCGRFARFDADGCTFTKNYADSYGGAVRLESGYTNTFRSLFKENRAKLGGGAISAENTETFIIDTTFDRNVAETLEGGAFYKFLGSPNTRNERGGPSLFRGATFRNNVALRKLGGAFVLAGGAEIRLCSSVFSGNRGRRVLSNGYVKGVDNFIITAGESIPDVTVETPQGLTFAFAACDF
eukprot:TRINITY_DN5419_c0_g5_i1.p1 TRINITY_DN5419_c0_g5~~TRINITY_DN5419_c0_g5_i1.p1  ORF type:complete len:373 (+),score=45.55 TRINITY_DN5419_c0_g5_i1:115-1233(+)